MPPLESVTRVFELAALSMRLRSGGIEAIALKGPALSQILYGDPHRRPCRDLDLLVRVGDLAPALRLLIESGFTPDSPYHRVPLRHLVRHGCEIPLRNGIDIKVDLHWGLAAPHYPLPCPMPDLFASARPLRIAGGEVRSPQGLPLLRYLAFHGAKHVWEKPVWVEDIAALLPVLDPADREAALRDRDPPVRLALELAHRLHGSPRPGTDVDVAAAVDLVLGQMGREPSTFTRIGLARRLGATRLRLLRHWLGCALEPTELDWQWAELPAHWEGLYPVVRLARLAGGWGPA